MPDRPRQHRPTAAILFAVSVFLSAFLLFQVQPVIGKYILPWFGSSPAVWTTCMLFFQVLLLVGYTYAHLLVRYCTPRIQAGVHCVLLLIAAVVLPITPEADGLPATGDDPTLRILAVLATSVGLPYLALSATGPLLIGWMARLEPDRPAYRLYALSNAGSLLALLTYPFVFEPILRLDQQTGGWSVGFGVFALACAACAVLSGRRTAPVAESAEGRDHPPGIADVATWIALATCGSGLLLATTNQLCLDVAVVPFLWVLPLSIYLLTFILCFEHTRWYQRRFFGTVLPLTGAVACYLLFRGVNLGLVPQIIGYSVVLFVGCMSCHGELVLARPKLGHLTLFFLSVSLGGALGGVGVALVAPWAFRDYLEFHVAVAATGAMVVLATWRAGVLRGPSAVGGYVALLALIGALAWHGVGVDEDVVAKERNFYGVLTVARNTGQGNTELANGRISHGDQDWERPDWPTSYYGPTSGAGLALRHHPARSERGLRIGVVGLGTGTLAAYANAEILPPSADGSHPDEDPRQVAARVEGRTDYLRFYEINQLVIDWAEAWFTYLADARQRGAVVDVAPGDARLAMQQELQRAAPQNFDVLAVDAFTSDAIPIHLLTAECLRVYWQHLADDGILAVHVSNRFIDLVPVLQRHGVELGKSVTVVRDEINEDWGNEGSTWMLLTTNEQFLDHPAVPDPTPSEDLAGPLWTDDYSSVAPLIQ